MRPAGRAVLALACAGLATVPAAAGAAGWTQQGGDPGRSGYQAVGDGTAPVEPLWAAPGDVTATAPVITEGRLEDQRVAYGTADGRVHVRRLDSGAPVGPAAGVALGGLAAGAFGNGRGASASFAAAGTRVYVLHAADNRPGTLPTEPQGDDDVMLAVVDAGTGALVSDTVVAGTAGLQVSAPALVAAGALLFLATAADGDAVLFRMRLADGQTARVSVPGAAATSGPSVAWLAGASGEPEPYAILAAGDRLRTFSIARFPQDGPASGPLEGRPGVASVAVAARGTAPGEAGSGAPVAPALVTAVATPAGTRVVRLVEAPGAQLVVQGRSPLLPGGPAPALAVAQEVVGGQPASGWIVAGTTESLYILDARALTRLPGDLRGGFATAVAAAAGSLAFAVRDDGTPAGVDLATGAPLPLAAAAASTTTGQPAISRGLVVMSSARGLTAFRLRCGNALAGTRRGDRIFGGVAGDVLRAGAGDDLLAGAGGDDCLDGGSGADALAGDAGADTLAGGSGADELNGGDGDDRLFGLDGRDRLSGAGGADRLAGGRGADSLSGGDGDDRLNARGGGRDRLRCGAGRDTVLADRRDRVASDCERVLLRGR